MDKVGIAHCGVGPDPAKDNMTYAEINVDSDIGAVIVGFDVHFSFSKMIKAATYLKNQNVLFISTNTDERFPSGSKLMIPGTSS